MEYNKLFSVYVIHVLFIQVTMTVENPNGLSFDDTDDQFELKHIPETNIFIIRQRVPSTLSSACKCVS